GHRIHYDQPYVTQEEGYPGLIVHGPLQATLMAQTILDAAPGGRLTRFVFRGKRPCFAGNPLSVLARVEGGNAVAETRDGGGAICMQAEAVLG
ncbi:MAG: acyl-CoA dehydrogenase, partial [Rubritepida sp.]|nr:acyl-CoA dehydrogenase [Rubritepida sp.]